MHICIHVSTHSRPKAAGKNHHCRYEIGQVSTHSRPKAAGPDSLINVQAVTVSTHSRPKAAGCRLDQFRCRYCRFNTQPPEGGWMFLFRLTEWLKLFQHTAARRRLDLPQPAHFEPFAVSTHSRPKAAGCHRAIVSSDCQFQHTAARRRLADIQDLYIFP